MKEKVLIIHGWEDNGNSYWIPWLKKQFEEMGYTVFNPSFPNPKYPKLDEWLKTAKDSIGIFNQKVSVVAYSSGFVFSLQLLSSLKSDEKIKRLIGMAPFDRPVAIGGEETNDLYKPPINYQNIIKKAEKFYLIAADNDKYIPLSIPLHIQKELNADLQIVKGGGLLNFKSGYFYPHEVLRCFDE